MPDVRMPNGMIIRNVPQGTPKEVLLQKMQKYEALKAQAKQISSKDIKVLRNNQDNPQIISQFEQKHKITLPQLKAFYPNAFMRENAQAQKQSPIQTTPKQAQPNAFTKAMQARGADLQDIMNRYETGQQGLPESVYQGLSKALLGTASDIAGVGLSAVTPDVVKESLMPVAKFIAEQPTVQQAVQVFQSLPESTQATLEATGLLPFGAIGKAVKAITPNVNLPSTKGLAEVGQKLEQKGVEQIAKKNFNTALNFVLPEETKKIGIEKAKRTTLGGGILKPKVYTPTPRETAIAEEFSKLNIPSSSSFTNALNTVQDVVAQKDNLLKSQLKSSNINYDKKQLNDILTKKAQELSNEPLLVGDAEKVAKNFIREAKKIYMRSDNSVASLLEARKKFDDLVQNNLGDVAFNSDKEKALNMAVRQIRSTMNNFIADRVPNAQVKKLLKEQNLLLEARDNLAPKSWKEAKTVFGRKADQILKVAKNRDELIRIGAVLTGTTALGAAAGFAAPAAAALGAYGTAVLAKKILTNPKLKIIAGKALQSLDKKGDLRNLSKTEQEMVAKELALLPAPDKMSPLPTEEFFVNNAGIIEGLSAKDLGNVKIQRKLQQDLGLTPDVLNNLQRIEKQTLSQKYGQSELGKFVVENPDLKLSEAENLYKTFDNLQKNDITKIDFFWKKEPLSERVKIAELLNSVPKKEQKQLMGLMIKTLDKTDTLLGQRLKEALKQNVKKQ